MSSDDDSNQQASSSKKSPKKQLQENIDREKEYLMEQNKRLRKKLKQLSFKLDDQIQKAMNEKMKPAKYKSTSTAESQSLELSNAYKMIDRLQKTVKQYQSKQAYQISVKRIMDLESFIKKKEQELEELKIEVKTNKKIVKQKDRHINQLIENSKKMTNPAEDKEVIRKLKSKIKQVVIENQKLRKRQLEKHQKLISAQRKIVQIEQEDELPIGREQSLLKELQQYKTKYKQTMMRVQRQNVYIVKLNERLSKESNIRNKSQGRKVASKSMQELPELNDKKIRSIGATGILEHIPSPYIPSKLRRY